MNGHPPRPTPLMMIRNPERLRTAEDLCPECAGTGKLADKVTRKRVLANAAMVRGSSSKALDSGHSQTSAHATQGPGSPAMQFQQIADEVIE